MWVHDVVHLPPCWLKRYHSDGRRQPPPLCEIIDNEPKYQVEHSLNHRTVKRGRKTKVEYLLTFWYYGPEHNVWQKDMEICE